MGAIVYKLQNTSCCLSLSYDRVWGLEYIFWFGASLMRVPLRLLSFSGIKTDISGFCALFGVLDLHYTTLLGEFYV
jgi:hypothetical protein